MKSIAPVLFCLLSFSSVALAGSVSGKVVGWPHGIGYASQPGAVWLEGGSVTVPVPRPNAVMEQQGGRFTPAFLIIVVGQTVEMPNLDDVAHNVYSFSAPKTFNLGFYAKGEQKSVTFERPGLEEVACSIHNFMRAKILVVPTAYYSTIASDGSFHIRGVPEGKYTLKFWAEGITPVSQDIEVSADGITHIDFQVTPLPAAQK